MYRSLALLSFAVLVSPLTLAQSNTDCRRIAAATVAELRAGYESWSEEAEQLARAAAGAACVKATLSVQTRAAGTTGSLDSTVVPAAGAPAAGASGAGMAAGSPAVRPAAVAQTEDQSGEAGEAEEAKAEEKESSESWSPFSDIKFNKVSARPGKKPYERRRESLDEED